MSLINPGMAVNAASWVNGFLTGLLLAAGGLFALLVKLPSKSEVEAYIRAKNRPPAVDSSSSVETLPSAVPPSADPDEDVGGRPPVWSGETEGAKVFGKPTVGSASASQTQPPTDAASSLKRDIVSTSSSDVSTAPVTSVSSTKQSPPSSSSSSSASSADPLEVLKSDYNLFLSLSLMSKHWSGKTSGTALLFFHDFARVHKQHASNLKKLKQAADTIGALAAGCEAPHAAPPSDGSSSSSSSLSPSSSSSSSSSSPPPLGAASSAALSLLDDRCFESDSWSSLASALSSHATHFDNLVGSVSTTLIKRLQHLQMEQSHLQDRVSSEVNTLLKRRADAEHDLVAAKKERDKAQGKVELLLSQVAESTVNAAAARNGDLGMQPAVGERTGGEEHSLGGSSSSFSSSSSSSSSSSASSRRVVGAGHSHPAALMSTVSGGSAAGLLSLDRSASGSAGTPASAYGAAAAAATTTLSTMSTTTTTTTTPTPTTTTTTTHSSTAQPRTTTATAVSALLKAVTAPKEVDEHKATNLSKALFKKLQEASAEVDVCQGKVTDSREVFVRKLPTFINDMSLLEETRRSALKDVMNVFADSLVKTSEGTAEGSRRLSADVSDRVSSRGGGLEKLLATGEQAVGDALSRHQAAQAGFGSGAPVGSGPPEKIDMTTDAICALAAMRASSLGAKANAKLGEASRLGLLGVETAMWLNAFGGRIYRDAGRSPKFVNWAMGLATSIMNKGKKPRYVGDFTITDLKMGDCPPIFKNATWVHPSMLGQVDLEHDAAVDMDVVYRGTAPSAGGESNTTAGSVLSFTVNTQIWMNWPYDNGLHVPIKIFFTLLELVGKARMGVRKDHCFASFLANPHMTFDVKSSIGQSIYLKDAPFIEKAVINMVKKTVEKKLVWPKAMKIKLLWPKAWWPGYRGVDGEPESWGRSEEEFREFLKEKKEQEEKERLEKERLDEDEKFQQKVAAVAAASASAAAARSGSPDSPPRKEEGDSEVVAATSSSSAAASAASAAAAAASQLPAPPAPSSPTGRETPSQSSWSKSWGATLTALKYSTSTSSSSKTPDEAVADGDTASAAAAAASAPKPPPSPRDDKLRQMWEQTKQASEQDTSDSEGEDDEAEDDDDDDDDDDDELSMPGNRERNISESEANRLIRRLSGNGAGDRGLQPVAKADSNAAEEDGEQRAEERPPVNALERALSSIPDRAQIDAKIDEVQKKLDEKVEQGLKSLASVSESFAAAALDALSFDRAGGVLDPNFVPASAAPADAGGAGGDAAPPPPAPHAPPLASPKRGSVSSSSSSSSSSRNNSTDPSSSASQQSARGDVVRAAAPAAVGVVAPGGMTALLSEKLSSGFSEKLGKWPSASNVLLPSSSSAVPPPPASLSVSLTSGFVPTLSKEGYMNQNVLNGMGMEATNLFGVKRYVKLSVLPSGSRVLSVYVERPDEARPLTMTARNEYVVNDCLCRPSVSTNLGLEIVVPAETAAAGGENGGGGGGGGGEAEKLFFCLATSKERAEWLLFIQMNCMIR